VAALLAAHGPALRRVARRWSLCDEDAEDALQRSLEIYVRRLATVERATEAAWLKVVIRNEALAIRRARGESVGREDPDLDGRTAADLRELDDRVAARERSARSAEALRELKHDEALALLLKAEGHSYQEIAASQGWTYTKVNRAITEGRARFLKTFRAIEEGEACDRLAPMLAALANGAATAAQLREARPHLRHCATCRAALRALHVPVRRKVAALLPLGAVVEPIRWWGERFSARGAPPRDAPVGLHPMDATRIEGAADKLPVAVEHAERATRVPSPRPALQALLHRVTSSDLATSVQLATSTGGGRTAAVAALIGVCLSGVGAGTYCVATLVLPDPPVVKREQREARHKASTQHRHSSQPASARSAKPRAMAVVTPAPTAAQTSSRRSQSGSSHRPRTRSSTSNTSNLERQFGFESLGASGSGGSASPPAASTASDGSGSSTGSRGGGSGGGGSGGGSVTSGGEFLP
jgi:RNA polymerase sigma factor (sigma-70 family)